MFASDSTRIHTVLTLLRTSYPNAHIALSHWRNPWELLVAVILSAQCTDVMVNKVTEKLFRTYPTLNDYVQAKPEVFEQDIKSTGFYRAKTKNILAAARLVQDKFHGQVPKTMDELLQLPGVARKTANIVLGNAYGVSVGIAVDTHVQRISQRLRLVPIDQIGGKKAVTFIKQGTIVVDFKKDADTKKIEEKLMETVPAQDWMTFTYEVIDHGRGVCKALRPMCSGCQLRSVCPASRV